MNKNYIKVHYKLKDDAKRLSCCWDPEKKSWFYIDGHCLATIEAIRQLVISSKNLFDDDTERRSLLADLSEFDTY